MAEKVTIPVDVFKTAERKEDIEDRLLSQNPAFIKRMKKAREDDLNGLGRSWEKVENRI